MITASSTWARRAIEIARDRELRTVVVSSAARVDEFEILAEHFSQVVAVDVNRSALEHRVDEWRVRGLTHVRPIAAPTRRGFADAATSVRGEALYVLTKRGSGADDTRDAIFHVPRGSGVIVLRGFDVREVEDQLLRWSPEFTVEHVPEDDGRGEVLIVRPQRTLHVTFLIEKYTHEYAKSGLSINLDNLVATLHQTGFASYDVVHYDEFFHEKRSLTTEHIGKPSGVDEHVLVFVCHYHSPANPSPELIASARTTGSKIVGVWLDKLTSVNAPNHAAVADVNVVLDGNDFELPNSWPIYTPKNPVFFRDPGLERDKDVTFIGESRYLKQRQDFLDRLRKEARIDVTIVESSAADTKRKLSIEEYARVLQTSKISIALTQDSVRQLKGRIFETMHCGAVLACDANPHIGAYYTPDVEYLAFDTYDDMIARCRSLLDDPARYERMRRAGHARTVKYYNHHVFWRGLFARAGVMPGNG